jgi:hypothetical protein
MSGLPSRHSRDETSSRPPVEEGRCQVSDIVQMLFSLLRSLPPVTRFAQSPSVDLVLQRRLLLVRQQNEEIRSAHPLHAVNGDLVADQGARNRRLLVLYDESEHLRTGRPVPDKDDLIPLKVCAQMASLSRPD